MMETNVKTINTEDSEPEKGPSLWSRFGLWFYTKFRNSWYYRRLVNSFYNIRFGILNMIKWLPIVWKDRDWDGDHIMRVMAFKIRNTRDRILKNNIIIEEDQAQIKRDTSIVLELIKRFDDETYSVEYLDYLREEMNWQEDEKQIKWAEVENRLPEYILKYPLDKKRAHAYIIDKLKQSERVDDDKFVALIMSHMRQEKANALLFRIICSRIGTWWD